MTGMKWLFFIVSFGFSSASLFLDPEWWGFYIAAAWIYFILLKRWSLPVKLPFLLGAAEVVLLQVYHGVPAVSFLLPASLLLIVIVDTFDWESNPVFALTVPIGSFFFLNMFITNQDSRVLLAVFIFFAACFLYGKNVKKIGIGFSVMAVQLILWAYAASFIDGAFWEEKLAIALLMTVFFVLRVFLNRFPLQTE